MHPNTSDGRELLDTTLQDARYAVRTLRRNPGATLVGILVIALGIGANTAVFSVVHAVLLNPLPYPDPGRIVTLTYGGTRPGTDDRSRQISVADFLDWQRDSRSFESMAYYSFGRGSVVARAEAKYAMVVRASSQFFRAIGVQPSIGRAFSHEEGRAGGTGAALVSERYARQQFGEPSRAISQTLRLLNRSVAIVGVMPAQFDYPAETDIWLPLEAFINPPPPQRRGNNFLAVARLADSVTLDQAQAEMTGISTRLEQQYPDTNRNVRVRVTPLQREMVGAVEPLLFLLVGAVALVLLIACATMATLLLAKATSRLPEIAVRGALGASRSRIVRQLLVEALVQSCAAGTVGVLIAVLGTKALVAFAPANVPRLEEVAVNGPVLLFTLALCLVVSVLFGLPPALQAARVNMTDRLRYSTARVAGGAGSRTREALVVSEIALALVLVATGALLVKSLIALQHTPLGFDPANVLLMQASATPRRPDWSDSRAYFKGLLDDVRQMPGVIAAGAMMAPPGSVSSESGYWVDHMPKESPLSSARPAVMNVIAPGSFHALGIPIRQGRDFNEGDRAGTPQVAIINEAVARAAFRDREAIGRTIFTGFDSDAPMTIVGVVADSRQYGPDREPQPEVYMPYQQHFYNGATLRVIVKTAVDVASLGPALERKSRERAPEVSVRVTTMDALLAEHVASARFRAWLLSLFGIVALALALSGVYGVMAYVASQRSKEIGVRMALGASPGSVLWLMVRRGLVLTSLGLALGVAGAIASMRLVSGMLFEVTPHDLSTFTGVIASLALLSLLATYLPARRAARVDPLFVLRQD